MFLKIDGQEIPEYYGKPYHELDNKEIFSDCKWESCAICNNESTKLGKCICIGKNASPIKRKRSSKSVKKNLESIIKHIIL
ncbi:MAG: hypothetical protein NC489_36585 [Ruminococcus flavefaciens]|nr:hypothetical protein [Ruminococcus flavefaciens]